MIEVVVGDITRLAVDAVVNAANSSLRGGGGVDGAIHRAAGPRLLEACRALGGCPTGQARSTPGYDLRASRVIHAVGPVWHGGERGEDRLLAAAYRASLDRALSEGIRTIAFPAISTGAYAFPRERAARIALRVMGEYEDRFDRILVCLLDEDHARVCREALGELRGGL
jgi:O-acetyl-ADP-ribose deacetylase (regulator of RNase III)